MVHRFFVLIITGILIFGCSVKSPPGQAPAGNLTDEQVAEEIKTELLSITSDCPVRLVSVEIDEPLTEMLRPRENGWLSSDVAWSIPLSDNKYMWLFGDTFIGEMKDGMRVKGAEFIHNTIGIQDTSQSFPGEIEFYWNTIDGKSRGFIPPDIDKHYVDDPLYTFNWPTMGMMLDGEAFVYSYRLERNEKKDFAMPTTVTRIENPLDSPREWKMRNYDLGISNSHRGFHTAVYMGETYVYFLGFDDLMSGDYAGRIRRGVLARAKKDDIVAGGLGESYEFWAEGEGGPQWSPEPENMITLYTPGVTESGIQYVPEWDLYFTTTYLPSAPEIYITVAPDLTGPWCEPFVIYKVPEHEGKDFAVTSYAVRPHPEFSTKTGELVISYATNSGWVTDPLFTKEGASIYRPRFIRAQFELKKKN